MSWRDDHTLEVTLGDELSWRIELGATPATRVMTGMGGVLPEAGWNSNAVLAAMGPMARTMLRTGRIRLRGATPNGPRFKAAPLKIWRVVGAAASYRGEDLGEPAPLDAQTHLGDFWLPQRGVFFVGRARFTPPVEQIDRDGERRGHQNGAMTAPDAAAAPGRGARRAVGGDRPRAGSAGRAHAPVVGHRVRAGGPARPQPGAEGHGLLHDAAHVDRLSCGLAGVRALVRRRHLGPPRRLPRRLVRAALPAVPARQRRARRAAGSAGARDGHADAGRPRPARAR